MQRTARAGQKVTGRATCATTGRDSFDGRQVGHARANLAQGRSKTHIHYVTRVLPDAICLN